jgi:adenylate cyclase
MRLIGKKASDRNPNWCGSCFSFMSEHHGGADIEISMLFADIRGSTAVAEKVSSTEFRELVDRFYRSATSVVFDHDGLVDKFVGDELVAMFFPLLTGEQHAARAIEAARTLLHATGHADSGGPWVPLGAGVHTGNAWVGALGSATRTEFTAVGDAVNTTARLASVAKAGEILVTASAAQAAGLDSAERTAIELKGKEHQIEVIRLTVTPAGTSSAAPVV